MESVGGKFPKGQFTMDKIGVFVGEEIWTFFSDIYKYLDTYYCTEVFKNKVYNIPLFYGRLNRWSFRNRIDSLIRRSDLCFFEWASEYLAIASSKPRSSKIITRLHSFELFEWAPKINWAHVDRIIFVSNAMKQMFLDLYPQYENKTRVIYNGISVERFNSLKSKSFNFNIGMLGRISPIKRIYEVVLMLYTLINQGYKANLFIAGEPDDDYRYWVSINRLVSKLGLENAVFWDGYVIDTPSWLHKIDIYISNSYWEGQQVALIEAMASGCYCLSHKWAGAEEMLPTEYLFVTKSELIQKIADYSELSEIKKRSLQSRFRAIAWEKFDIKQTQKKIHQTILNTLAN